MSPWNTDFGTTDFWTTEVEVLDAERVRVSVMLTTDPGPMREFRPFLDVDLDEAHASELLGKLALALQQLRDGRMGAAVLQ